MKFWIICGAVMASAYSHTVLADCDLATQVRAAVVAAEAKEGISPYIVSISGLNSQQDVFAVTCRPGPIANAEWTDLVYTADCAVTKVKLHAE